MNLTFTFQPARHLAFFLAGLIFCLLSPQTRADLPANPEKEYQPAKGEFDALGKAVEALLKSRDTAGFSTNLSVSAEDWQSIITTNLTGEELNRLKSYAGGASYNVQRLQADAKTILSRADSLHLDFSNDDLHCQNVTPQHVGKIYLFNRPPGGLTLPYLEKLDLLVIRSAEPNQSASNGFKLTLRGVEKYPAGWRINGGRSGILWTGFPTNVVDAKTLRELALAEKIASFKSITSEDDPSLLKFGESLVRFVRERDTAIYQKELLLNSDTIWAIFEKSGRKGPTRQEMDEEVGKQVQEQVAVADKMLKQMDAAGIDLKSADIQIKEASMEHCQNEGGSGSLDQLIGSQFKLKLAVKTDEKAKNGTSLTGDYILAVKEIMKIGDVWKVEQDVQWEKLPAGVVDAQTAANIEFENYVAKYRALPGGTMAPEIEFTTLVGEKKMSLSMLRGKVVVLDFWATWCGPCQQPMADLQKIRNGHPDWQDKVAIVPVSIDDTLDLVRKHVDQRGWTNTFNAWAGDGGWHSAPAKAFRVTAVPTSYVIDQQGKIIWAGYPEAETISAMIDRLIKK